MVGGSYRVTYREEDVKELLINLKDRKKEASALNKPDEEAEFLEHCLKYLDPYETDILLKTFSERVSVRKYSARSGFSRNFISAQRERSVKLLTKFFNIKYGRN